MKTLQRLISLTQCLLCLLWIIPAYALDPASLLPPAQAFATSVKQEGRQLIFTLNIADGYYLYRDRLFFMTQPKKLLASPPVLPTGKIKQDPYFGRQFILTHQNRIILPLLTDQLGGVSLTVTLQGCAEVGVCYSPFQQTFHLSPSPAIALSSQSSTVADWFSPAPQSNQSVHSQEAVSYWTLWGFLIAGLGMAATACMYPLLPILSFAIVGQAAGLTKKRALLLSVAYVQGLALCYAILGSVAGFTGSWLVTWFQRPVVMLVGSAIIVLFALSMFDFFSIQLPTRLQTYLARFSGRLRGGRVLTVFVMGLFSALLIGPCIAPPLALALGLASRSGDPIFGAFALYSLALGLGLPLIIIGTLGGHILPKAGAWMHGVKRCFGVAMLALAIDLMTPFMPPHLTMMFWAMLAIGLAVFLRAFDPLSRASHGLLRLGKALAWILFLIGAAELVGVLAGAQNVRYPLRVFTYHEQQATPLSPSWRAIHDEGELDDALKAARGQPVLVDFYADWCQACKEMDATLWHNARIAKGLEPFVLFRVNVTEHGAQQSQLLQRYQLFGPPAIVLYDAQGNKVQQLVGLPGIDELLQALSAAS